MRSELEIHRAHDLLIGILNGEAPNPVRDGSTKELHLATDVLCWVLGCCHNHAFEDNLAELETALAERGFHLKNRHGGG